MKMSNYSGTKPTRKDYCQFIIAILINYTQTYMADHHHGFSHDAIHGKNLPFRAVLMDSWYATKDLMMHIDKAGQGVLLSAEIQPHGR